MYFGDVLYYNTVDWRTGWHVDVPGSYSALDMPHHAQATAARLIPSKDYFVDKISPTGPIAYILHLYCILLLRGKRCRVCPSVCPTGSTCGSGKVVQRRAMRIVGCI